MFIASWNIADIENKWSTGPKFKRGTCHEERWQRVRGFFSGGWRVRAGSHISAVATRNPYARMTPTHGDLARGVMTAGARFLQWRLAGAGRFPGRHSHIPAVNPYARMTHRSFESITIQKLPRNCCRRLRRRSPTSCLLAGHSAAGGDRSPPSFTTESYWIWFHNGFLIYYGH